MEEKKTIFDYLAQVLTVFGFSMLTLNLLCFLVGESAAEISPMFALGRRGIPVEIVFQFFAVAFLVVGARFVFFTDVVIKGMPLWLRTMCMLGTVVAVIVLFVLLFGWFPVDMWQPWVMFVVCFGLCFLGSYSVMAWKEKMENKRMDEALQRLKKEEAGK